MRQNRRSEDAIQYNSLHRKFPLQQTNLSMKRRHEHTYLPTYDVRSASQEKRKKKLRKSQTFFDIIDFKFSCLCSDYHNHHQPQQLQLACVRVRVCELVCAREDGSAELLVLVLASAMTHLVREERKRQRNRQRNRQRQRQRHTPRQRKRQR